MLKDILGWLHTGGEFALATTRNEYGDLVPTDILRCAGGEWQRGTVCPSSALFGLGICQCSSHKPVSWSPISRVEAIKLLKEFIVRQEADQAAREAELAWLDAACASCPA